MKRLLAPLLVALLAALVAVLPGCGEPGPHVVVWHAYRGEEEAALLELLERWEATHPGVTVEALAIPHDAYSPKLAAAVPHAHGPDLFIDAHERLGIYEKDGLAAPVGDAFPDEDVAAFDPVAVDAVTFHGARWAVPLASKCLALFVDEALVPRPTPATIEGIADLARTLPRGTYPLAYENETSFFQVPFAHAFGARYLDDAGHFALVGDAAARSVAFAKSLADRHVVPEEPTGALVTQLFADGHAATAISGPWLQSDIGDHVKYRVEPLPAIAAAGGARMRPYVTVEGVMLTPSGAPRPEVRALARWLGGLESAHVRATVGKQIVPRVDVWKDPEVAADAHLVAFHEATKEAIPTPTSTAMRAAWVPIEQAVRKALRGEASPEAALEEARARFDDAMKPPPPPPSPTPALFLVGAVLLGIAVVTVKRAGDPRFRRAVRESLPAWRWVAHAFVAILALVVLPLVAGAVTSFFAGTQDHPQYVGAANYVAILTARGGALLGHGSFYLTLIVTIAWTIVNVAAHLLIGLVLGLALSRPMMKLRALYRVLLILPWAVPSYVTALAWKGLFHRQFGAVNAVLVALGAEPVSWFAHFATAFAANVATNVWLGFPFMMVVTLGALTSIPKDVLEAAEVDGASRWQKLRLVTLPLLEPLMLPSVVLGAVWTFNMFNVVFLVSGGEPDETTDILVSEAYRWAFTRDAQYGYAAAYAVLIFFLLLGGTRLLGSREATS